VVRVWDGEGAWMLGWVAMVGHGAGVRMVRLLMVVIAVVFGKI
jgi:hypothetical protein